MVWREMPEGLASVTAVVMGWLLTYLLHSTVLIVGAWLLMRFVSLRPTTRDLLWKVALLGGVVTSVGAAIAANSGAGDRATPRAVVEDVTLVRLDATPAAGVWAPYDRGSPHDGGRLIRVRADMVGATPACRAVLAEARPGHLPDGDRLASVCMPPGTGVSSGWMMLFGLVVWLVGAMIGILAIAGRRRGVRSLVGRFHEPDVRCARMFSELAGSWAPAGVRLRVSDDLDSPCVIPGLTVVLPRRCERELLDAELRAVLAHELAHVARRDVYWATGLRVVMRILWVQPLNRLAFAGLVEATELACDDWALERTGEQYGLASSISRVAGWAVSSDPIPGVSMIGGASRCLSARVRRILHGSRPGWEPAWAVPILAALLIAPLYWVPPVSALQQEAVTTGVGPQAVFVSDSTTAGGPVVEGGLVRVFVGRVDAG
jgi:bla regulator protein blaR1